MVYDLINFDRIKVFKYRFQWEDYNSIKSNTNSITNYTVNRHVLSIIHSVTLPNTQRSERMQQSDRRRITHANVESTKLSAEGQRRNTEHTNFQITRAQAM